MTTATARKLVLVSLALMTTIDVARASREQGSLYKRLWALAIVAVILSAIADFVPTIAGPFALVMLLGKLSQGGDKVIQSLIEGLGNTVIPGRPLARTGGVSGHAPQGDFAGGVPGGGGNFPVG